MADGTLVLFYLLALFPFSPIFCHLFFWHPHRLRVRAHVLIELVPAPQLLVAPFDAPVRCQRRLCDEREVALVLGKWHWSGEMALE